MHQVPRFERMRYGVMVTTLVRMDGPFRGGADRERL